MTTVTLQDVKAKQSELAAMIARLEQAATKTTSITLAGVEIELDPGERYAGIVLNSDGTVAHHLILMAEKPSARMAWGDAVNWADNVGGSLPTRQEQALLYANCKDAFEEAWYWSSQPHEEDASYAWYCNFYDGYQYYHHKSYEGLARAVRRFNP